MNTLDSRPPLPEPQRERWQPLRIGMVDLFLFDSEEFWFRDGHLLLRGDNGAGKSKVLSLALPFLFDAQLRPSRIEPNGDPSKKMSWNLLMGSYTRRTGYTWIEFGRLDSDGRPRYLTLGAGLGAVEGKQQIDHWFFIIEGASPEQDIRIGQDIWLMNDQRVVLTKERLREQLQGRGTIFIDNSKNYRRAVDERLFRLGEKRYEALMDTLIQLRQPQLSRRPDETGLSEALSESLPPLPADLLNDVAEALNQLEEDRDQLDKMRQSERAVSQFEKFYRRYACVLTRRQARELRQAQTLFDNASENRNAAQGDLEAANAAEAQAILSYEESKLALSAARECLNTLRSDPANQDANRLSQAERDSNERRSEANRAEQSRKDAEQQFTREKDRTLTSSQRAETAQRAIPVARAQCVSEAQAAGLGSELSGNILFSESLEDLGAVPDERLASFAGALRSRALKRRESIRHLENRHTAVSLKQSTLQSHQDAQRHCQQEFEEAKQRRDQADGEVEAQAQALIEAWAAHCSRFEQLRFDTQEPLLKLADWVVHPEEEPNPLQIALDSAHRKVLEQHAARKADLDGQARKLESQRAALIEEGQRLAEGRDLAPPCPVTRSAEAREERAGAPFWQLVDFQPQVSSEERAGLEAALEASGLLDAWISPTGRITDKAGSVIWDTEWRQRGPVRTNLSGFLSPVMPEGSPINTSLIESLLAGVACGSEDDPNLESWITADGRFRLGSLTGAWQKPEAVYIGHTARAQARQRRLREISEEVESLDVQSAQLGQAFEVLARDRAKAEEEMNSAPSEGPLRKSILKAVSEGRAVQEARYRLDQSDERCRTAEADLYFAREALDRDAIDLQLPKAHADLAPISQAIDRFGDALQNLIQAIREWQRARRDYLEQSERHADAEAALVQRSDELRAANERAEQARVRYETLRRSVGAKVDSLRKQISESDNQVQRLEREVETRQVARNDAIRASASAAVKAEHCAGIITTQAENRARSVERWQRFAESSLLSSALPELSLPVLNSPWTIDPALQLARRAEQLLVQVPDDESNWNRIQRQVSEGLTELQSSLSALGHQAVSEPNDWGFTVHITYQNRSERPDTLLQYLTCDIEQRSELLTAREKEILENHLQTEVATEIQRLMRGAEEQVRAINEELYKCPTTTGIRFRLQWQPVPPEQGGPVGLEIARKRLLNTSPDLWSNADSQAIGTMLQQQIVAERLRVESDVSASPSLVEQLTRALDYRRWHRFHIELQRDKNSSWIKLSSPASNGERALGLTVPLFAAISSFYGKGCNPLAPRLILLDEAFVGIDDRSRAHCMGLVREFDLDFVITSEREWACYAALPGLSICHLQRCEGAEAVFVSRWTWDGRARSEEPDPERRFPEAG